MGGRTGGDMALAAFSGEVGTGADLVRLMVGGRGSEFLSTVFKARLVELLEFALEEVFFASSEEIGTGSIDEEKGR